MKIILGIKVHGFIRATAFFAGLSFGSSAAAQIPSYLVDLNSKTVTALGTLGGSVVRANGINDAGQVVGDAYTADGFTHAFITGPDGKGMRDLGTLGGTDSIARGINNAGQVVGVSHTAEGGYRAFITGANGVGMRDLGTLGGPRSLAAGINDVGQVVGMSDAFPGSPRAFITGPDGKGMMDLNSLVDLPTGVGLAGATAINDAGQVTALGWIAPIPEPEISALLLTGLALIGFMARREKMAQCV